MIHLDTETYSETPIQHGTYRYAADCEVMIVTYAQDDSEIYCWDVTSGEPMPEMLRYLLLESTDPITAHNAMFDRNVIKYGLGIDIPITRWRCNMVRALAHSLPGKLDPLCDILGVAEENRKLKSGKNMINLFCKPLAFKHSLVKSDYPNTKAFKAAVEAARLVWPGRATRHTHPEDWAEFLRYATNDIAAMRELDKLLPRWNYDPDRKDPAGTAELDLWHLDQVINDRGFLVDRELAEGAVAATARAKKTLDARTVVLTDEEITSTTKRDQLLVFLLKEHGIELPDMQKSTLERRIQDPELPTELRELLAIRLQASSTSVSKYKSLLKAVSDDGRLRGTLQFDGAGRTRRHAGRTFQPQNLPRMALQAVANYHRVTMKEVKGHHIQAFLDEGIAAMKGGFEDLFFPDVMALAASAVRGCIIAPPGRKLVISDLANIEGRDAAWLAGENWKLHAFREYDAGTGPDLYVLAYARAFKVDPSTVTKDQRQIGKVMELMLQYEGGVGAYVTGAAAYGIDLEALALLAYDTLPADVRRQAEDFLKWTREQGRGTFGLSDRAFVTCDTLKRLWRMAHPEISSLWGELKDTQVMAINYPGKTFTCRRFKVRRDGDWLRVGLPSGRAMCYPQPRVDGEGRSAKISYMGVNQYTRKWTRLGTYGGKTFEQTCQALAGDVMKANMPRIEDAGYNIVMSVHDELPTETDDDESMSVDRLSGLLATVPEWAEGMPLAAAGFETYRYRKE